MSGFRSKCVFVTEHSIESVQSMVQLKCTSVKIGEEIRSNSCLAHEQFTLFISDSFRRMAFHEQVASRRRILSFSTLTTASLHATA